jgi:hypothetical protein
MSRRATETPDIADGGMAKLPMALTLATVLMRLKSRCFLNAAFVLLLAPLGASAQAPTP